jgi:hypothetical protein
VDLEGAEEANLREVQDKVKEEVLGEEIEESPLEEEKIE